MPKICLKYAKCKPTVSTVCKMCQKLMGNSNAVTKKNGDYHDKTKQNKKKNKSMGKKSDSKKPKEAKKSKSKSKTDPKRKVPPQKKVPA